MSLEVIILLISTVLLPNDTAKSAELCTCRVWVNGIKVKVTLESYSRWSLPYPIIFPIMLSTSIKLSQLASKAPLRLKKLSETLIIAAWLENKVNKRHWRKSQNDSFLLV